MRTEGICSAPLHSRDIRDKVRNGILALFRDQLYFSATKQRRTKSFGTHVHNTSNNTSTKLQLQQIKLHIEIVNSKPVTPTTILLRHLGAQTRPSATSPVKGFTSEVQLTQERNLYQTATVKQFISEVNRPSLPSLLHHGVHFFHCSYAR